MTASEILVGRWASALPARDRDELVASILLQVRRLDRLVANLLELSRLEAGAAAPRRELWPSTGWSPASLDALATRSDRVDVDVLPDALAGRGRPGADRARARERARERPPVLP